MIFTKGLGSHYTQMCIDMTNCDNNKCNICYDEYLKESEDFTMMFSIVAFVLGVITGIVFSMH